MQITFSFLNGKNIIAEAEQGENLLLVMRRAGVDIDAPCNGNGMCGKCRVKLMSGKLKAEKGQHLSEDDFEKGIRLACESFIEGEAVIEVPESASAFRRGIRTADLNDPKVKKAFDGVRKLIPEEEKSAVFTLTLTLSEPSLSDTLPDSDRLKNEIYQAIGEHPALTMTATKKLASVLRAHSFSVRAVLAETPMLTVLDILPPEDILPVAGLAVDIGTTTVSAVLVDMETKEILAQGSCGNGQILFGADVISRIIESVKPGGSERLKKAIIKETLEPLISSLCRTAGIGVGRIYRVVIAGNTTMEHLALGVYADPIRTEPYIPTFYQADPFFASDLFPMMNPEAELWLAPNVGSYVGGDITAGAMAADMPHKEELTLFVDLGTNGELVIGTQEYLMSCACSAGPAFEGGDISCGMRATNGAVDEVKVDAETMEPTLSVIGGKEEKVRGLCGSGIIDMISELLKAGIISPKGKFIREGGRVRFDEHGMGRYVFADGEETADGRELSVNEVDIDNLMRAKAAIFSAIRLMCGQLGVEVTDITEVLVAGGIGGGIDFENAVCLGMLPDLPMDRFHYVGNTSLSGAFAALVSKTAREAIENIGQTMMYVELSGEPGYMDEFVGACFFPHTDRTLFPSIG